MRPLHTGCLHNTLTMYFVLLIVTQLLQVARSRC